MKNIDNYDLIIINILFFIFPFTVILGNLYTNLNIILLCICALFFYGKKIIKIKLNFFDKIILVFFFYTVLVLIINFLESRYTGILFPKFIIYKTLLYFKYLVLYLIFRFLITEKILKLNWFFLSCTLCASFICIDIFVQAFFGKDMFGIEPGPTRHFSGVFGNELIAGGYLQRFALFSFFLPFLSKKNIFYKVSIQTIFLIFFLFGIVLSGNRMPLILFLFSYFIFLSLNTELRKYFFSIFIIVFLFLFLNFSINQKFNTNISNFYYSSINLVGTFLNKNLTVDGLQGGTFTIEQIEVWQKPYVIEFYCFQSLWKKNPFFGGGLRSYKSIVNCNSHPHNYYLEILVDLGLVGLSIILIFIFMLLHKIFINKNTIFKLNFNTLNSKSMPFFLIFVVEFFPLRSSGSFFTTGNASLIFIVLAILVSLICEKKNNDY